MQRAAILFLMFPFAAAADDPFACVDPEVADALLGFGPHGRPTYSTALPDGFPRIELPEGFDLVAGKQDAWTSTAFYRRDTDVEAALSQGVEALVRAGWRDASDLRRGARRGGFRTAANPATAVLCNEAAPGLLQISASRSGGRTLVALSTHDRGGARLCSDLDEGAHRVSTMALQRYLPTLDVPADADASNLGMGGGGEEFHANVVVTTSMGRAQLLSHFGDQVRDQQWEFDTAWSGRRASGSVWSATDEDGSPLLGMLTVGEAAANVYNVRFGVSVLDTDARAGGYGSTTIIGAD